MERVAIARVGSVRTVAHAMQSLNHYLMGTAREGFHSVFRAAEMARSSHDTTFTMHALPHLGLNLGSVGRYAEAANHLRRGPSFRAQVRRVAATRARHVRCVPGSI